MTELTSEFTQSLFDNYQKKPNLVQWKMQRLKMACSMRLKIVHHLSLIHL